MPVRLNPWFLNPYLKLRETKGNYEETATGTVNKGLLIVDRGRPWLEVRKSWDLKTQSCPFFFELEQMLKPGTGTLANRLKFPLKHISVITIISIICPQDFPLVDGDHSPGPIQSHTTSIPGDKESGGARWYPCLWADNTDNKSGGPGASPRPHRPVIIQALVHP
jgi:hypothetical protein